MQRPKANKMNSKLMFDGARKRAAAKPRLRPGADFFSLVGNKIRKLDAL